MDKGVLSYAVEKTNELMSAPSCSAEAKKAAQTWLDSIGTKTEATETKKYIDELQEDVMPLDNLIGFAESDGGIQAFGEDTAKNIAAHAKEIRSAGAEYCDCPACKAAAEILEKKDELLK